VTGCNSNGGCGAGKGAIGREIEGSRGRCVDAQMHFGGVAHTTTLTLDGANSIDQK
jgi:hypothetical protein